MVSVEGLADGHGWGQSVEGFDAALAVTLRPRRRAAVAKDNLGQSSVRRPEWISDTRPSPVW